MDEMTTTDSYTNVTMMNSTLNETSWNQTYVNVTNSTMHFNETVANPKMETCNLPSFNFSSFQLNDEFSKLHLGKRNDKDHGYLWAEFADFAVWYEVLDPYDPEIDKKLMGDECHRVGKTCCLVTGVTALYKTKLTNALRSRVCISNPDINHVGCYINSYSCYINF